MRKKFTFVVLAAPMVAAIAGLSLACGSDAGPSGSAQAVVLESISPSSGPFGTAVAIRGSGFSAANNDVGFTNPKISYLGRHTAYLSSLPSSDGKTLRFSLPDTLGACAFSQLKTNEACEDIGLLVPSGATEVFVVNENGTSNSVTFIVSGPDPAQRVPVQPTTFEIYAQIARDNPGFAGLYLDPDAETLHLLVKKSASPTEILAVERAVRLHLGRSGWQLNKIEIDPANHDFAELKEWHDRVSSVVSSVPGYVFMDIDEVKNGLRIGVETPEAQELVEQRLAELGIPDELVEIEIVPS